MDQIIIHVDMDAFYASVEARDNPGLRGKPLIIGSMPYERGVVATCSYEARKFGVHSAMNIKEAYRLCPDGIYMHPNFVKYKEVSEKLHEIWNSYATASETIALDEAFLDVTETAGSFDRAREMALEIKKRTRDELGLSCSVGLAYSKSAAKTASEEKKPDGYFEILTPQDFVDLVIDRDVRVLFTVGARTADKLYGAGINTVSDLLSREDEVVGLLGRQGKMLIQLARGIDDRKVVPYRPEDAKSVSREITFQEDVHDYKLLEDVLLLMSMSVIERARRHHLRGSGVVLKLTYSNMKSITRSRVTNHCDDALSIQKEAVDMLYSLKKHGVRLIGVGIYNLSNSRTKQLTLDDAISIFRKDGDEDLDKALAEMSGRYGIDFSPDSEHIYRVDSLHSLVEEMRVRRVYG
ncbi:MAG: DNA polymerase IV [Candidatus Methanomethylophilaceae archaeon]|nr:DNA polymerase IV [Candidatus Methanomethylophilaceae archaeon]